MHHAKEEEGEEQEARVRRSSSRIRRRTSTTTLSASSSAPASHSYRDNDDNQHHISAAAPLSRRHSTLRTHPIADPVNATSLACGLLAGVAQAGVFNPYDRALYLSVRDHRPFLHRANFVRPYLGFTQSIGGRALAGGLYFPMEHFFLRRLNQNDDSSSTSSHNHFFLAGTLAGALNAGVLNPLSAVKYKTWGRTENRGAVHEAARMLRRSQSVRPFFNGLGPTLARDVAFGGVYTYARLQLPFWFDFQQQQWVGNFFAAALATVISGPFNYVRNVQFATRSSETADGMVRILRDLAVSVRQVDGGTLEKLHFLQQRLRIGWGTARVAMGMTFAHAVYDWLHENLGQTLRSLGRHGTNRSKG